MSFTAFCERGCNLWKYLLGCFKHKLGICSKVLKRAFLEATLSLDLHAASSTVVASDK